MPFIVSALRDLVRFLLALPFWSAVLQIAAGSFAAQRTDYVIPPSPNARNSLHNVAAVGDHTVVVSLAYGSSKDRAVYREIRSGTDDPVRVRIPLSPRMSWAIDPWSEAFVINGNDWWYATLDDRDDGPTITFVKSDGSRATYAKPPELRSDGTESRSWPISAVPGEKPRVIGFNYQNDETIAVEIDLKGKTRLWRLPPMSVVHAGSVIVKALPDGRIALIENHDGVNLYFLGDEGRVESIPLRNVATRELDADIDSDGATIIAVVRRKGTGAIEAARIDLAHPAAAEWRALAHETQLAEGGGLRVVTTADGYAAAWLNDAGGRRIEAADIDRRGHWGPVVEVGRPFSPGFPFFDLQSKPDELLFWWDDNGRVVARRLPLSLKGYAAMTALQSADPKQPGDPLRDDGLMPLLRDLWNLGALQ